MLTEKGNAVLQKMWNKFHDLYVENNPGCNENEVERAFLYGVLNMVDEVSLYSRDKDGIKKFYEESCADIGKIALQSHLGP